MFRLAKPHLNLQKTLIFEAVKPGYNSSLFELVHLSHYLSRKERKAQSLLPNKLWGLCANLSRSSFQERFEELDVLPSEGGMDREGLRVCSGDGVPRNLREVSWVSEGWSGGLRLRACGLKWVGDTKAP